MLKILFLVLALMTAKVNFAQNDVNAINNSISLLTGNKWSGRLISFDNKSGKKISVLSELNVTRADSTSNVWLFNKTYPDDMSANTVDSIVVSSDGKMINDETIISILFLDENTMQIITEKKVPENDALMICRYTYTISPKVFTTRKDERNEDNIVFTQRNIFEYTR